MPRLRDAGSLLRSRSSPPPPSSPFSLPLPLPSTSRWLIGTYVGCFWAVWAMWASGSEGRSWVAVIILVAPIYFVGTIAHSNKSVDYAGLVAAFTAPIIAVGYDWDTDYGDDDGVPDDPLSGYIDRAFARLSESFAAACIIATVVLLVFPQSACGLLHHTMIRSLRGLHGALKELIQNDLTINGRLPMDEYDAQIRWRERYKKLRAHLKEQRVLLNEAAEEPRAGVLGMPTLRALPVEDFERAISAIEEVWQCALSMHQYVGQAEEGEVARRLMATFKGQTVAVCESILTTLEHTIAALLQNKPHSREKVLHVIPQSLLLLEAQMQTYWDRIDLTWRETLATQRAFAGSTGAVDDAALSPLRSGPGPSGRALQPMAATDRKALASAAMARMDLDECLGVLHVSSFLSKFRSLGDQVANLAWRVATILQKEHPTQQVRSTTTQNASKADSIARANRRLHTRHPLAAPHPPPTQGPAYPAKEAEGLVYGGERCVRRGAHCVAAMRTRRKQQRLEVVGLELLTLALALAPAPGPSVNCICNCHACQRIRSGLL